MRKLRHGISELLVVLFIATGLITTMFVASRVEPEFSLIRGQQPETAQEIVFPGLETTSPSPSPTPDPTKNWLLPDMRASAPKQLYITSASGTKKMRFDTTFTNIGDGPLEMTGKNDEERGVTVATQRIKTKDETVEELQIGEFVYHPGHKHWHVDRYALFELFSIDEAGNPKEVLASTDKFSFCIWDEHTSDLSLPNAPQTRQYLRCITNIQGNSVGWGDTYTANIEGQEITIAGIPDGDYMVKSTVNADRSIIEKDYSNNSATLYINITGNSIRVIEDY